MCQARFDVDYSESVPNVPGVWVRESDGPEMLASIFAVPTASGSIKFGGDKIT